MRKAMAVLMAFALLLSVTTPLFAGTMGTLKDGTMKILSSPLEIPNYTIEEMNAATFKPFGIVGGVLKGSVYSVQKLSTGIVDVATIPLHLHE